MHIPLAKSATAELMEDRLTLLLDVEDVVSAAFDLSADA
jgi:hypothetical protein